MTPSATAAARPATLEEARGRVIFALDVPSVGDAEALVEELGGTLRFFKVGLELWCRGAVDLPRALRRRGFDVFLDLKLHDIPATVAGAARAVADAGARFLTVHGPPTAVTEARRALEGSGTQLLGVTVLTSMTAAEYAASHGLPAEAPLAEVVLHRARLLVGAGCDGLVCSPAEIAPLRGDLPSVTLVTPGIRPAGAGADDQKRVATPEAAARAGADYLVVGRPIRDAPDRRAAAEAIVSDAWRGFTG